MTFAGRGSGAPERKVATILTSRHQQRVLADMRSTLRRSDPRLVARFAAFTRLTEDEEIPSVERVRAGWLGWALAILRGCRRALPMLRPRLLLPAIAAALVGMLFLLTRVLPTATCPAVSPARATTAIHHPTPLRAGWPVPGCWPGPGHPPPTGR